MLNRVLTILALSMFLSSCGPVAQYVATEIAAEIAADVAVECVRWGCGSTNGTD